MQTLRFAHGLYGDAAPGGRYAVLIYGQHIETDTGRVALPNAENVLFLRALWRDGQRWMAGVGHTSDLAWLHTYGWRDYGRCAGVNPCAFGPIDTFICKGNDLWMLVSLDGFRLDHRNIATGSQGIRWIRPDGTVVTGDSSYADISRGVYQYTDFGDVVVGEGADEAGGGCVCRFADDGILRRIEPGQVRFVRAQRVGTNLALAFTRQDTREVVVVYATLDEMRQWTPVDVTPQPPVEPPMSAPNHLDTVRLERAKYGTPLGVENAWKVTNAVAYTHRLEGFGLRRKLDGQNYNGYSIDVIIHKPSGEWIDILGSSELAGNPQWSLTTPAGDTDVYWSPPLPPEDGTPEPPIEPPVDDDLEDRVRYLEEMVDHIVRTMRSV